MTYLRSDGGRAVQTYPELLADARSVLAGLNRLGLLPGDKVIFQLEHAWEFLPAFWACSLGGLVPRRCRCLRLSSSPTSALDRLRQAWSVLEGPVVLTSREFAPSLLGVVGSAGQAARAGRRRGGPPRGDFRARHPRAAIRTISPC